MEHSTEDIIRSNNLKATPARVTILMLLQKSKTPLDVAEVADYVKKHNIETNQSTIYRILNAFVENGLAKQVEFQEGKSRYELASLPHHHHAVCIKCGSVQDIEHCEIEPIEKNLKKTSSFLVQNHNLEFFGLCSRCQ